MGQLATLLYKFGNPVARTLQYSKCVNLIPGTEKYGFREENYVLNSIRPD